MPPASVLHHQHGLYQRPELYLHQRKNRRLDDRGFGLTATHISIDSGNRRIAVYGANSGVASGQRVQLYYNSDTDFGLYTTDSAGYCVAQLGSSNSIAGWTIDTTSIRKGNVSLGSDGSSHQLHEMELNNDGSGRSPRATLHGTLPGTLRSGLPYRCNGRTTSKRPRLRTSAIDITRNSSSTATKRPIIQSFSKVATRTSNVPFSSVGDMPSRLRSRGTHPRTKEV